MRKVRQQMTANGISVTRCTVERLMKQYVLQGVWHSKGKITTRSRGDQKHVDGYYHVGSSFRTTKEPQLANFAQFFVNIYKI